MLAQHVPATKRPAARGGAGADLGRQELLLSRLQGRVAGCSLLLEALAALARCRQLGLQGSVRRCALLSIPGSLVCACCEAADLCALACQLSCHSCKVPAGNYARSALSSIADMHGSQAG